MSLAFRGGVWFVTNLCLAIVAWRQRGHGCQGFVPFLKCHRLASILMRELAAAATCPSFNPRLPTPLSPVFFSPFVVIYSQHHLGPKRVFYLFATPPLSKVSFLLIYSHNLCPYWVIFLHATLRATEAHSTLTVGVASPLVLWVRVTRRSGHQNKRRMAVGIRHTNGEAHGLPLIVPGSVLRWRH